MKRIIATCLIGLTAACAYNSEPVQNYPYGMTEKEWNELSIKDKAMIRRDFYFVEKGNMGFVNPEINIEGKEQEIPYIYPDTFFLAHADAQDHLLRYGYNYDKHAHAYAMTATRSGRFSRLLHILRITDWTTFAQTPAEKFQMILQKELEEIENMKPCPKSHRPFGMCRKSMSCFSPMTNITAHFRN